jgi:hypothetical protein
MGVDDLDLFKMLATFEYFEENSEPYPIPEEFFYFKELRKFHVRDGNTDFFGEKYSNELGLQIWEGKVNPETKTNSG